eukprot:TRINITY_DN32852_c0_g1_i1.p1 TRINITY_DN32852_c0_g1~~TRINITY_DN32852_c0_g1_i1.p1  ORF type:complete len:250 (+),score=60.20 TRINITY_DN32852_c0_g1_i1:27-776(+)
MSDDAVAVGLFAFVGGFGSVCVLGPICFFGYSYYRTGLLCPRKTFSSKQAFSERQKPANSELAPQAKSEELCSFSGKDASEKLLAPPMLPEAKECTAVELPAKNAANELVESTDWAVPSQPTGKDGPDGEHVRYSEAEEEALDGPGVSSSQWETFDLSEQKAESCHECGIIMMPDSNFCTECGAKREPAEVHSMAEKSLVQAPEQVLEELEAGLLEDLARMSGGFPQRPLLASDIFSSRAIDFCFRDGS